MTSTITKSKMGDISSCVVCSIGSSLKLWHETSI